MLDVDRTKLSEKLKDQRNWIRVTEQDPRIFLAPGPVKVYFALQDDWGNFVGSEQPIVVQGWAIPTWSLSLMLPILAITFCLFCLTLAPWIRYCLREVESRTNSSI
jgi:hypothetical protein